MIWPFFGGGPMGKAPTELAGGDGVICSAVACHPQHEVVAAGFQDGLVLLAEIGSGKVVPVAPPGHGAISALGWNAGGNASRLRHRDRFRRDGGPDPAMSVPVRGADCQAAAICPAPSTQEIRSLAACQHRGATL